MAANRCPEPLDLPVGMQGRMARAAYGFMISRLFESLDISDASDPSEISYHEIGAAVGMEMVSTYQLRNNVADSIVFLAVRDIMEINDPIGTLDT